MYAGPKERQDSAGGDVSYVASPENKKKGEGLQDPPPLSPETLCSLALFVFEVIGVYLNKLLPLVRRRSLLKDRLYRTNRLAGPAVDAFLRIDIELLFLLEIFFFILGRVNAIYRADIHASGIFDVYARLSNYVGHRILPSTSDFFLLSNRMI